MGPGLAPILPPWHFEPGVMWTLFVAAGMMIKNHLKFSKARIASSVDVVIFFLSALSGLLSEFVLFSLFLAGT